MHQRLDPFSFLVVSVAGWINERQQQEFVAHYHFDRNHQALDNRLIISSEVTPTTTGTVQINRRLGGMLNYYYRKAA
jgi:putative transposase